MSALMYAGGTSNPGTVISTVHEVAVRAALTASPAVWALGICGVGIKLHVAKYQQTSAWPAQPCLSDSQLATTYCCMWVFQSLLGSTNISPANSSLAQQS
jgi:hypothetical protein